MSIAVEDLHFSYGAEPVLRGVSFAAKEGSLLAVLGANGAGKSTLFRCILGLNRGYTGTVLVDGQIAAGMSARELAHKIAYIPQSRGPAFHYTVMEMVLMGTTHRVSPLSAPGRHEMRIAREALGRMGIERFADKRFANLSGGEQQLVLVARALAQQSKILLMDEPTSALDYGNQSGVLEQVSSLAEEGYTILLSTHNPQHALWYADEVLALQGGKTEAFGPPETVMDAALVERLYGILVHFLDVGEDGKLIIPSRRKQCG